MITTGTRSPGPNGEDAGGGRPGSGSCPTRDRSTVACNGPHAHPYKLDSWGYLDGFVVSTPATIKQAIYAYGPVTTSVCVGSLFQAYKSGIFNANETCINDRESRGDPGGLE